MSALSVIGNCDRCGAPFLNAHRCTEGSDLWISLEHRLPQGDGKVMVIMLDRFVEIEYSAIVRQLWEESISDGIRCIYSHWAPLPTLTKDKKT